ncbi:no significant blast hit [Histoplasma capsulatum var. duboisii H88]|uniref:No significant blast hit n=1 Tax=Ajellomyces capsulatus (strain H88) TaxID=544711 RepID=A0A8A1LIP4_AJEC8|nr:no significant blast hit [Histoplasma capsulatum var. duboisii H88]
MRCHRCPVSDAQRARRRVRKRGLFRGRIAMSAEQSVDGIGLVYLIDFEAAQRSYFGVDILLVKYGQTSGCDMGFNTFIKQDTLG